MEFRRSARRPVAAGLWGRVLPFALVLWSHADRAASRCNGRPPAAPLSFRVGPCFPTLHATSRAARTCRRTRRLLIASCVSWQAARRSHVFEMPARSKRSKAQKGNRNATKKARAGAFDVRADTNIFAADGAAARACARCTRTRVALFLHLPLHRASPCPRMYCGTQSPAHAASASPDARPRAHLHRRPNQDENTWGEEPPRPRSQCRSER